MVSFSSFNWGWLELRDQGKLDLTPQGLRQTLSVRGVKRTIELFTIYIVSFRFLAQDIEISLGKYHSSARKAPGK
jgi:Mn-dependent DtxR family transcriptional regulator